MNKSKQYEIPKRAVIDAYQRVKANKGSAGIDGIDFGKFEEKLNNNLYKIELFINDIPINRHNLICFITLCTFFIQHIL